MERQLLRALAISLAMHSLLFLPQPSPAPVAAGAPLRALLQHQAPRTELTAEEGHSSLAVPDSNEPRQPEARTYPQAVGGAPDEKPSTNASETGPTDGLQPGVDLAGLREYNIALARVASRFRNYPRQAWEAGQEGRVVLRLRVAGDGTPTDLALLRGSGHDQLDRAALDMMRLAASHTVVPERLLGRSFSIDLAVDYDLNDAPPGP
ncbi:MAG: TonB family protein [Rhodocyclaceae bacterium]|nr:TonB family protein [Rhodocyclaceae bacterium]